MKYRNISKVDDERERITAIIGIIFGILVFVAIYYIGADKLIDYNSRSIFSKYVILLTLVNAGLYFILCGVLIFRGILVPYYSNSAEITDKAKFNVISIPCISPFLISLSVSIFEESDSVTWKLIWSIIIVYIVYIFKDSLRILKNSSEE